MTEPQPAPLVTPDAVTAFADAMVAEGFTVRVRHPVAPLGDGTVEVTHAMEARGQRFSQTAYVAWSILEDDQAIEERALDTAEELREGVAVAVSAHGDA
jgi:archaellum component FlaG (FlaF/FlaG flagellin family)